MRCVDITLDVLEGWTIVALLRANGIDAHLFNENLVRQNWFEVIAYGGFRISVDDENAEQARDLIAAYRRGDLMIVDQAGDYPACPICDSKSTQADSQRRRWPFLAYICIYALMVICAVLEPFLNALYLVLILLYFCLTHVVPLVPKLLRRVISNRYRCRECAATWREPPTDFGLLQRDAEQALHSPAQ